MRVAPWSLPVFVLALAGCSTTTAPTDAAASSDALAAGDVSTGDASTVDGGPSVDASSFKAAMVDTHAHIWPRNKADNDKYIDDFAATARAKRVRVVLGLHARQKPDRPPTYSKDHDTWTLEAVAKHPDVFVPALNGFDPESSTSVDYVKTELATGKWKMIGELDVRNRPKETTTPMNQANLMQIYALAGQAKVPVMVHFDPCYGADCATTSSEFEEALTKNSSTIFITAHGCNMTAMKAHSNLYCEYEPQGGMPAPTELFDRVMLGSDEQHLDLMVRFNNKDDYPYAQAIDMFVSKLSTLSAADQERVLVGTAQSLKLID